MKSFLLFVLLTFTTQIFADEYLPGRLESKVDQYKILAKCAVKDGYMHRVIGRHMPELVPHMKGLETAFQPWKK